MSKQHQKFSFSRALRLVALLCLTLSLTGCITGEQEYTIRKDGSIQMYSHFSMGVGKLGKSLGSVMKLAGKTSILGMDKNKEEKKEGEKGEEEKEGVEEAMAEAFDPEMMSGMMTGVMGLVEGMMLEEFRKLAVQMREIKAKDVTDVDAKGWSKDGVVHFETWVICKNFKGCEAFNRKAEKLGIKEMEGMQGDPMFAGTAGNPLQNLRGIQFPTAQFKVTKNEFSFTLPMKASGELVSSMLKGMPLSKEGPMNVEDIKGLAGLFLSGAHFTIRVNTPRPIKAVSGSPTRPTLNSATWTVPVEQIFGGLEGEEIVDPKGTVRF